MQLFIKVIKYAKQLASELKDWRKSQAIGNSKEFFKGTEYDKFVIR